MAEEIDGILEEFEVRQRVVAATVDNAANMSVALKTDQFAMFRALTEPRSSEAVKL